MKKLLLAAYILAGVISADAAKKDWKVGVQCWTFNHLTLLDTADYCTKNGIKYLEVYPGQKIGGDFDGKLNHDISSENIDNLKKELEKRDVTVVSYGCVKAGNEKDWDKIFSFCKEMGIDYVISEPAQSQMQTIDAMTQKYGVELGIHNHAHPTPDEVAKRLEGMSDRVGIAPDNGHWQRHGHDPLKSLKRFEGKVKSIHLKDVNANGQDVPYGTGAIALTAILDYLDATDYKGQLIIEYESGNEVEDVKRCSDYLEAYIKGAKSEFVDIDNLDQVFENYNKKKTGPGWANVLAPKSRTVSMSKPKEPIGVVTASTEPAGPNETADKAFDGNHATKFCTLHPTMSLQVKLDAGKQKVSRYALVSANDAPGCDPKEWKVMGSNDGKNWSELDRQWNETFPERFERREFGIKNPGEYLYYKLDVTKNAGDVKSQLAEFDLIGIIAKCIDIAK